MQSREVQSIALFTEGAALVSIADAVEAFLRLELAGKSAHTVVWYRRRLAALAAYLGDSRPLGDVLEAELLEWRASLADNRLLYGGGSTRPEYAGVLSIPTQRGYVRAAKRFFRWLFVRGVLPVDLAAELKPPAPPRYKRMGISDANARLILEAARSDPRDYALIRFLEATGCRRAGAAGLRLADLNLDSHSEKLRRRVMVREKGCKDRPVFLTRGALAALLAWLEVRPHVDDDHVFLGAEPGERMHALSPDAITGILRRYKERLHLRGACSPHQWRHRFCRKKLQEGMNLASLSQIAGHNDPAITIQFYGGLDVDELQDIYDSVAEDDI